MVPQKIQTSSSHTVNLILLVIREVEVKDPVSADTDPELQRACVAFTVIIIPGLSKPRARGPFIASASEFPVLGIFSS